MIKETEAFRVLCSADRQILLHELVRTDEEVAEAELARKIAAHRHRVTPESVSTEKIEGAHIRLVHTHLPMLRELNIVEWDDEKVVLADKEERAQLLAVASELEDWPPHDLLQPSP